MFECSCGVWIDCSIHGYNWDRYFGLRSENWNDCPRRCNEICFGQIYIPQWTTNWGYFDQIYQSQDFVNQMANRHARVGTVADNFFR